LSSVWFVVSASPRVGVGTANPQFMKSIVLPIRKNKLRLSNWDYTRPGPYFITLCTNQRMEYFDSQIQRDKTIEIFKQTAEENQIKINAIVIAADHLHSIVTLPGNIKVSLWKFVGMTKLRITKTMCGLAVPTPTREEKNNKIQRSCERKQIWQKSFYDHIIRNQQDYLEKAEYIENHTEKEAGKLFAEWH
jgi:putative transposase